MKTNQTEGSTGTMGLQDSDMGEEVVLDQELINSLKLSLEDSKKELSEKYYAVSMTEENLSLLKNFFLNDAPWRGLESIGIIEATRILNVTVIEKGNVIMLKSTEVQAIHYFLSNNSGKGLDSATLSVNLIKGVWSALNETLERVKMDSARVSAIEEQYKKAQQGIK